MLCLPVENLALILTHTHFKEDDSLWFEAISVEPFRNNLPCLNLITAVDSMHW